MSLINCLKENIINNKIRKVIRSKYENKIKIANLEKLQMINSKNLNSILNIAQSLIDNNPEAKDVRRNQIYTLIKSLVNHNLYSILNDLYCGNKVDEVHLLYQDIGQSFPEYNYCDNIISIHDKSIAVKLNDDAVTMCPWNISRYIDAINGIGKDVNNDFEFQPLNHFSTYFYPVGITIVFNGNHSILSGILKNEGVIYPTQTYDFSHVYDQIYFDGLYYRRQTDNEIIHENKYFELGAIFEIGRLLTQNGIK